MKELDPLMLLAVFQEMLGPFLWLLLAVIVVGTLAFLWLLIRERTIRPRRLVWSQLVGLFGGVMSLVFMGELSSSGYRDAAGAADWLFIALVFVLGAIGRTVVTDSLSGWLGSAIRRPVH